MSKLEELLQGVDVKWLSVDEIFTVKNGYTPSKSKEEYWNEGTIPWFRMEDIRKNGRLLINALQNVSELALKGKLIPANSLIMSTTATLGEHALVQVPFLTNQQITSFSLKDLYVENINTKYLFYCFFDFGKWCKKNANQNGGLGIIGLSKLKKYKFPIPCPDNPEKSLQIQQEIVRVLDELTSLTNQLTTELETERQNRKKQFEFFREQLFTFEEGEAEYKTLGNVFEFKNGINKGKEFFGKGDKIINYTDVFRKRKIYEEDICGKVETNRTDIERFNCKKGDVFFTRTSETKNEIGYASVLLSDIEICVFSGFLIRARPKTNLLLPEYCSYCFTSDLIRNKIIRTSNMTTRVTTTGNILSKIEIPIPSLAEQERIVKFLDQFDATHTAIEEEITKEVKLRTQQYEYYREKLLSFPQN